MQEAVEQECDARVAAPPTATGCGAGEAWVRQARRAIRSADVDFFRPSPARYWTDFLLSLVAAYASATAYLTLPFGSWPQLVAFPLAAFWLYRLGSLIHEVCHLGRHEMPAFKLAWNLLAGVVTLTPSPFFTRHHRDHHSQRYYGTPEDPEYVANVLAAGSLRSFVGYTLHVLVFPLLVFLRFLLFPVSFLHPRLREWTLARASSLTFNHRYERKLSAADRRAILAVEVPCFLRAALIPLLVFQGVNHWTRIPMLYALAMATVLLNQLRQMADHHFDGDGSRVDLASHVMDSCNFTRNDPLTLLFFPFSIRYHALHHLFPSLPYHNLKRAHEHLIATLPADSPYRVLDRPGWWSVAKHTLLGPAGAGRRVPWQGGGLKFRSLRPWRMIAHVAGIVAAVVPLCGGEAADAQTAAGAPAGGVTATVESAIRREMEATVKAFNAGDAAALAGLFMEKGELVDENGTIYAGRKEIADLFQAFFAKFPKASLDMEVTGVRTIGDGLAVEEGVRQITASEGQDSARIRYVATRSRAGDSWPIASYREFADDPAPTAAEMLEPMGFLVGDWIDEDPEGRTSINYRWSEDGNFLLGEFSLSAGGMESKSVQRIGWDPVEGVIRSWTFDSDGGFSQGEWTPVESGWVSKTEATMPDGTTASATVTVTVKDKDHFLVRSSDRIVAGVVEPAFELLVARRPPQPAAGTPTQPSK